MKNLKYIVSGLILLATLTAQASINVCISNQEWKGDALYFDVFLSTSEEGEVVYLSHSDFVISLTHEGINNPTFTKVSSNAALDAGYCTLRSTEHTIPGEEVTTWNVQKPYYESTHTAIVGQQLIINLNGHVVNNKAALNTRIARIDHLEETHCLGRFKLSGVNNPTLKIAFSNRGLTTRSFGHDPFSESFITKEIDVNSCNLRESTDPIIVEEEDELAVEISPNPTAEILNVWVPSLNVNRISYQLFSVSGGLAGTGNLVTGTNNKVDVNKLVAGVYLLKLEGIESVFKLIKQ